MSLDTILMWDFFQEERLAEMEAWSVLCQGCQIIKQKLSETELLQTCPGDVFEKFIITDRRLELSEAGLVFSPERRVVTSIRDHLPARMRPILELTTEDLGRVSVFSLARLVLANIDNVKSAPLYSLLSTVLSSSIDTVPSVSSVLETCLKVISPASAKRILSSMYFKHQGKCRKEYGARNFSTIRSLPSLALVTDSEEASDPRRLRSFLSHRELSRRPEHRLSEAEERSVSGVCDYIRGNKEAEAASTNTADSVFSLLELPGLKYNQRATLAESTGSVDSNQNRVQRSSASVRLVNLDTRSSEVSLTPGDVYTRDLLKKALDTLHIDPSDFHLFCLCKRSRGEYFFLSENTKLADVMTNGVSTFYVRLVKPPGLQIRKLYSKFLLQSDNFGVFKYDARETKSGEAGVMKVSVDICGMKINEKVISWRHVKQVSFSHTCLQILHQEGEKEPVRIKICFSAVKTKFVYDLVIFLINANKEVEKTREKELSNLDDLCDQLMKITRTALKVITTPNRKRTKSMENETNGSASKKQKFNNGLGFPECKKNSAASQYRYQYKLYLENEEDELYVHVDKLKVKSNKENIPKTKPRISTNPNAKTDYFVKQKSSLPPLGSRQGPVMGTTTLKRKLTTTATAERENNNIASKKIVCVSMSKMEYLAMNMVLCKKEESIHVDQIVQQSKKKIFPGDKIIAVNGKTLENTSIEKSSFLIANSGHLLNFILQR